jgi:putative ABC transport system permease protein
MDQLGWRVGDTFQPYHGLAFDPATQHEEVYTVVGRLAPTNTPSDRVIWIPLDGVQTMEGHDPRLSDHVSAVLLKFRAPTAGMMLDVAINRRDTRMTLAFPIGAVVADLFNRMAWAERVLGVVAWLVAVVAAGSVLAGVQASLAARRRDLAILRALGARRRTVAGLIVAEAGAIGLVGAVAAVGVHAGLMAGAAAVVRAQTGVVIGLEMGAAGVALAAAGMVGLAVLGGVVPALAAYRTPVAEHLNPVA